jgi:hypothetical protein
MRKAVRIVVEGNQYLPDPLEVKGKGIRRVSSIYWACYKRCYPPVVLSTSLFSFVCHVFAFYNIRILPSTRKLVTKAKRTDTPRLQEVYVNKRDDRRGNKAVRSVAWQIAARNRGTETVCYPVLLWGLRPCWDSIESYVYLTAHSCWDSLSSTVSYITKEGRETVCYCRQD